MNRYIDTHTHLFVEEFDGDRAGAVERAMEDPKLKEAREKCERAIELEAELEEALSEDSGLPDAGDTPPELSEGTRLLFEMMGKANMNLPRATPPKVNRRSREEIMKEYKQTIRDVNKIFEEMLPPAGSTPQEQRNFYSARKVAVVTTTKTRSTAFTSSSGEASSFTPVS
jgi:hypothetical protein